MGFPALRGMSFAQTMKEWFHEIFLSIEANWEFHSVTNWTTYTADKIYYLSVEEGKDLPVVDDPSIQVLEIGTEDVEGEEYREILILVNPVLYSRTMTPMEATKLSGKNLYMFANWKENYVETVEIPGIEEEVVLEIKENVEIPDSLDDAYETVEDVEEALKKAALKAGNLKEGDTNTVYYEITLKMKVTDEDGNEYWVEVSEEDFPKEGILVTIPFPEGIDPDEFNFIVTHMISPGDKAGEVEVLKHKVTEEGLQVRVFSLSPFGVTYVSKGVGNGVPATGDNSSLGLYLAILAVSVAGGFVTLRKFRKN